MIVPAFVVIKVKCITNIRRILGVPVPTGTCRELLPPCPNKNTADLRCGTFRPRMLGIEIRCSGSVCFSLPGNPHIPPEAGGGFTRMETISRTTKPRQTLGHESAFRRLYGSLWAGLKKSSVIYSEQLLSSFWHESQPQLSACLFYLIIATCIAAPPAGIFSAGSGITRFPKKDARDVWIAYD